jgi:hypothetical protein
VTCVCVWVCVCVCVSVGVGVSVIVRVRVRVRENEWVSEWVRWWVSVCVCCVCVRVLCVCVYSLIFEDLSLNAHLYNEDLLPLRGLTLESSQRNPQIWLLFSICIVLNKNKRVLILVVILETDTHSTHKIICHVTLKCVWTYEYSDLFVNFRYTRV